MVYTCKHCKLLGAGWPTSSTCPSCGGTVLIKERQDLNTNDRYKGDFIPIELATKEILSIMNTFNHTHGRLYVSHDIDDFLKMRGLDKEFNYFVDPHLHYLEMNVR